MRNLYFAKRKICTLRNEKSTMAHKGHAANKKDVLQPKSEHCKQKRRALQIKKGNRCKQNRKPLQTKKQKPQRKKEELLNAGVRCNKKRTHFMRDMALYSRQNSTFSFQIDLLRSRFYIRELQCDIVASRFLFSNMSSHFIFYFCDSKLEFHDVTILNVTQCDTIHNVTLRFENSPA